MDDVRSSNSSGKKKKRNIKEKKTSENIKYIYLSLIIDNVVYEYRVIGITMSICARRSRRRSLLLKVHLHLPHSLCNVHLLTRFFVRTFIHATMPWWERERERES